VAETPFGVSERGLSIVTSATNTAYQAGYDSGAGRRTNTEAAAQRTELDLLAFVAQLERLVARGAPRAATAGAVATEGVPSPRRVELAAPATSVRASGIAWRRGH
jgi:hypothetical protein